MCLLHACTGGNSRWMLNPPSLLLSALSYDLFTSSEIHSWHKSLPCLLAALVNLLHTRPSPPLPSPLASTLHHLLLLLRSCPRLQLSSPQDKTGAAVDDSFLESWHLDPAYYLYQGCTCTKVSMTFASNKGTAIDSLWVG